jgi:hypothetical protein
MSNNVLNDACELKIEELEDVSGGLKGAIEGGCSNGAGAHLHVRKSAGEDKLEYQL